MWKSHERLGTILKVDLGKASSDKGSVKKGFGVFTVISYMKKICQPLGFCSIPTCKAPQLHKYMKKIHDNFPVGPEGHRHQSARSDQPGSADHAWTRETSGLFFSKKVRLAACKPAWKKGKDRNLSIPGPLKPKANAEEKEERKWQRLYVFVFWLRKKTSNYSY